MNTELQGRKIVLGVTGGIAAYKACTICRLLIKMGADVQVVMTPSATKLVGAATFEALSGKPVGIDIFSETRKISHISVVKNADLYVIAPATANTIAKFASGIADNLLTGAFLAATCPILVAPAMNVNMYRNIATQDNIKTLLSRGIYVLTPDVGELACGVNAEGRLPEPEEICEYICSLLNDRIAFQENKILPKPKKPLELGQTKLLPKANACGINVLITAGPTVEDLDPVRFISNRSSGKMGYALAKAWKDSGANVTLISGPVNLPVPSGIRRVDVRSTGQMLTAVDSLVSNHDIFIGCAAVADYRAASISKDKIKKQDNVDELTLKLVKNPDIIATVGNRSKDRPFTVGFAAETSHTEENARRKLNSKNLDLIILNDVSKPQIGFDSNENEVTIFDKEGKVAHFEHQPKALLAEALVDLIVNAYKAKQV